MSATRVETRAHESHAQDAHAPAPYRDEEWRPASAAFKTIPAALEDRARIRQAAVTAAARLPRSHPPFKPALERAAAELLAPLGYDAGCTGFAMVLINNEFWRGEFAAVPFAKRLLSLPHCLKQAQTCSAKVDGPQLLCQGCGLCSLADFSEMGRRLGYQTLIADGTPAVLKLIASGRVEAILGVACLNVLEKAFDKVLQLGLPALAIPLLRDACHNTAVDEEWVLEALGFHQAGAARTRSFVPLLRDAGHWFDAKALPEILPAERATLPRSDKVAENERLALAWVRRGGKRFRPFVTAAAWQALTGADAVPLSVRRAAAAMELFHKASLIHDDIEDDDDFRYGTQTLHKAHTVPVALNLGDYLLGRGYRLLAGELTGVPAEQTLKILRKIAAAHVRLAEGQGAELLWRQSGNKALEPLECLRMYALKAAPAFDAALYTGVVLAGHDGPWDGPLAEFARHLGVAYQIQNDLRDVEGDSGNKENACGDILRGRPTVLFALALEAADENEKAALLQAAGDVPPASCRLEAGGTGGGCPRTAAPLERLREIYFRHEIPAQATLLAARQRARALEAVADVPHDGLRALFAFLAATLLD